MEKRVNSWLVHISRYQSHPAFRFCPLQGCSMHPILPCLCGKFECEILPVSGKYKIRK